MDVAPANAAGGSAEHVGAKYWFCSESCRKRFVADPLRYVTPRPVPPTATGAADRIYTCPMHPQIRQKGPGSCPICGMTLEPLVVSGEEGPDPEFVDMTRRFWVSVVLTLPLLVLVMADMMPGELIRHLMPATLLAWAQLVLATPVVLWGGWPFFVRGWASIVPTAASTCSPSSRSASGSRSCTA